jgi:hypothetical protein
MISRREPPYESTDCQTRQLVEPRHLRRGFCGRALELRELALEAQLCGGVKARRPGTGVFEQSASLGAGRLDQCLGRQPCGLDNARRFTLCREYLVDRLSDFHIDCATSHRSPAGHSQHTGRAGVGHPQKPLINQGKSCDFPWRRCASDRVGISRSGLPS